jgi:hypothetical protein
MTITSLTSGPAGSAASVLRHGGTSRAAALATCAAAALAAAACSHTGPAGQAQAGQRPAPLHARQAPAGWHRAALPGGGAVLAFPPSMHVVRGDAGTVSAASFSASGQYLLYLNVTPKQGHETLSDWADFRIDHQRDEETPNVRKIAEQSGIKFIGGTGSCVTDAYVTKVGAHHYTEIACFVRGKTRATVIVAAAPSADWGHASSVLSRAIEAYQVS